MTYRCVGVDGHKGAVAIFCWRVAYRCAGFSMKVQWRFFGGRVTYKCVGVSVVTPSGSAATAALMSDSRKSSTAVLITAGVAWFTRPTSSSACRIFLMRACGDT